MASIIVKTGEPTAEVTLHKDYGDGRESFIDIRIHPGETRPKHAAATPVLIVETHERTVRNGRQENNALYSSSTHRNNATAYGAMKKVELGFLRADYSVYTKVGSAFDQPFPAPAAAEEARARREVYSRAVTSIDALA